MINNSSVIESSLCYSFDIWSLLFRLGHDGPVQTPAEGEKVCARQPSLSGDCEDGQVLLRAGDQVPGVGLPVGKPRGGRGDTLSLFPTNFQISANVTSSGQGVRRAQCGRPR